MDALFPGTRSALSALLSAPVWPAAFPSSPIDGFPAQRAAPYIVGVGSMVRKVESFLLFTLSYAVVIAFVVGGIYLM